MRGNLRVGAVLVVAVMTGTGGCAAPASESEPGPGTSASPGAVGLSARGNVAATVGDPVEAPVGEGSPILLSLTVDEVRVLQSCSGRAEPTQRPDFGQFVVLEVTAVLQASGTEPSDLPPDARTYAGLGAERFRIFDTEGAVQEITSTDASWACFEDSELLPAFVDVGQTVSGYVVLDSASPHGAVVFSPDDAAGWEWAF